jgi:TPR repeat protein
MKAAFGLLLLVAAGCASPAREPTGAGQADFPAEVKRLSGATIETVAADAFERNIWSQIELARRYEFGVGLAADRECAFFWYRRASHQTYGSAVVRGAGIEGDRRHPAAIEGMGRLEAGGPLQQTRTADPPDEIVDRCTDTLEDLVSMRKFGHPAKHDD